MNLTLILIILRAAAFLVDALQAILDPDTPEAKREALSDIILDESISLEKLLAQFNANGNTLELANLTSPITSKPLKLTHPEKKA